MSRAMVARGTFFQKPWNNYSGSNRALCIGDNGANTSEYPSLWIKGPDLLSDKINNPFIDVYHNDLIRRLKYFQILVFQKNWGIFRDVFCSLCWRWTRASRYRKDLPWSIGRIYRYHDMFCQTCAYWNGKTKFRCRCLWLPDAGNERPYLPWKDQSCR